MLERYERSAMPSRSKPKTSKKRGKLRVGARKVLRCHGFPVGMTVGFDGLGRPVPRACPAESRITVPAHTRCPPPSRGGRKPRAKKSKSATVLELPKRTYTASTVPRLFAAEKHTKKGAAHHARVRQGKKLTPKQAELEADRSKAVEQTLRSIRTLLKDLGGKKPSMRDIHPKEFEIDPCTGTFYEEFKGPSTYKDGYDYLAYRKDEHGDGPKGAPTSRRIANQLSRDKLDAWHEHMLGCVLDQWCQEYPQKCGEEYDGPSDSSFDPSAFSGICRGHSCPPKKPTKKRRRRR